MTNLKTRIYTGKKEFCVKFDDKKKLLIIEINAFPEKGKANKEIIKKLKKFFRAEVKLVSGETNKNKIINIEKPKEEIISIINKN